MYVHFFQENYKVPRLRKGALPSVFLDCPKYLSKVPKARKCPKKRQILPEAEETKRRKVSHTSVVETLDIPAVVSEESLSFDVPDMPEISDAPFKNTENITEIERITLFESMFVCKDLFKVPTAWTRCDINDDDFQAIQFVQCTGRMDSGVVKTISQKKVVLSLANWLNGSFTLYRKAIVK